MKSAFQAYYTKSQPILDYMVSRLRPKPRCRVLEPCAGDGVLVDAVLSTQNDVVVDAYEFNPAAVQGLLSKYGDTSRVHVTQSDTLLDPNLLLKMNMGGYYDFAIANPPYGAWQEYEKRSGLKALYPGLYVRETYALFLYQSLHLLRPGGRLVFIIPDTYLNLHMHTALRHSLLTESCIESIALFPSSFFPGVNFGYSNLSIITLRRMKPDEDFKDNQIEVSWGYETVDQLASSPTCIQRMIVRQGDLLDAIDHALFLSSNRELTSLVSSAATRVGHVADCVTGIYSGNDKIFLRVLSNEIRNGAKYQPITPDSVYCGEVPSLKGLPGRECFIPIVKGGGVRFIKPDLWFLDWSEAAVRHYMTDKKARFQNPAFYFRKGIAIPMVSSTNVTASLMEKRLFDQSIVGLFPHEERYLYYLLGFFNTSVCTSLLRVINPSANNSANYVKKLPFVAPSARQLAHVDGLVTGILADVRKGGGCRERDMNALDEAFERIYLKRKTDGEPEGATYVASRRG
jgi:hypothetical protein